MPAELIMHKDVPVIYADYRGLKTMDEMIALHEQVVALQLANLKIVHRLINITGTPVSHEFTAYLRKKSKQFVVPGAPHFRVAVVGVSGIQKIILNGIAAITTGNITRAFDGENDARNWLASA